VERSRLGACNVSRRRSCSRSSLRQRTDRHFGASISATTASSTPVQSLDQAKDHSQDEDHGKADQQLVHHASCSHTNNGRAAPNGTSALDDLGHPGCRPGVRRPCTDDQVIAEIGDSHGADGKVQDDANLRTRRVLPQPTDPFDALAEPLPKQ
jgi:hypothetical protein